MYNVAFYHQTGISVLDVEVQLLQFINGKINM